MWDRLGDPSIIFSKTTADFTALFPDPSNGLNKGLSKVDV